MRDAIVLAALLVVSGGALAARPQAPSKPAREVAAALQKKYDTIRDFTADFVHNYESGMLHKKLSERGTVRVKKPGKMRWDYKGPDAQLYLADGRYFYFRPAGSSQVIRRGVDEKGLGGKIPLLLLFGKGEITALFRVDAADPRKGGEETVLRLSPRDDGAPEVRRIDLVVGTGDVLIREIHVFDRMGGENHLYLTDVTVNPSLPPDVFRFRKPAGVSVVDG